METETILYELMKMKMSCLEMFAAAWLQTTGLDPTKTVMIEKKEQTEKGMVITYWFEEKKDQVESNLSLEIDRLAELLPKLKRNHYECEDCYYSCPKCKEGCCDEREGDQCTCGADKHNALVDEAIKIIQIGGEKC